MKGGEIKLASECFLFFIKSLHMDCYFNVVCFGSEFNVLFESPVPYTNENAQKAIDLARLLRANMGGTVLKLTIIICFISTNNKTRKNSSNFCLNRWLYI